MKPHVPEVKTDIECPNLHGKRSVDFEVNVFRGAERGGMEVVGCSEFLEGKEGIACGHDCIHTQEAQAIHQREVEKHQEDLRKIGRDVIG